MAERGDETKDSEFEKTNIPTVFCPIRLEKSEFDPKKTQNRIRAENNRIIDLLSSFSYRLRNDHLEFPYRN